MFWKNSQMLLCGLLWVYNPCSGWYWVSLFVYIYIAIVIASCIFFPALQTYYGVNSTLSVDLHTKIMFVAFIIFSGDSLLIFIDTLITGVFLIPFLIWMNYIEFQSTPLQHFSCTYTHLKMPCRHMPWIIDLVENFIVYKTIKPIHTILVFHWLGSMSSACYHVERSYFCHRMQYIAQAEQWISISNTGTLEKTSDKNRLPNFCT